MITVAILTVSDSSAQGARDDVSGPALRARCEELGWNIVASKIVPDEPMEISEALQTWTDKLAVSLILTTGGTGVSPRDFTPEATRTILHRELPGFGELMRAKGLEQTRFSPLSRSLAGTRGSTLIINLPGSPKGAVHSLQSIEGLVPHTIQMLKGNTEHVQETLPNKEAS